MDSAGSYFGYGGELPNRVAACVSVRQTAPTAQDFEETPPTPPLPVPLPATCTPDSGDGISWETDGGTDNASQLLNLATNGVRTLSGGAAGATYVVSSAVSAQKAPHTYSGHGYTRMHTVVEVADVS